MVDPRVAIQHIKPLGSYIKYVAPGPGTRTYGDCSALCLVRLAGRLDVLAQLVDTEFLPIARIPNTDGVPLIPE